MPPSPPWGSPILERDDTGSHGCPHHPVAGLVSSHPAPMATVNGALFYGIWPRPLSQAKAPGPRAVQVVREGRVGQRAVERVPRPAPVPPSQPTASSPPGRSRVGDTGDRVGWIQVTEWGGRSLFFHHPLPDCLWGRDPMPSKVGIRTGRGCRPSHGAGPLEEEVERPGHLRLCPEARKVHGAKHVLLGD